MIDDHAIIEREGFKVPLIGVPPDSMKQQCDGCHLDFPLNTVMMTDAGMLCLRCRTNRAPISQLSTHKTLNPQLP